MQRSVIVIHDYIHIIILVVFTYTHVHVEISTARITEWAKDGVFMNTRSGPR